MTDSIRDNCNRLRALANNRPNAIGRQQVADALVSKFEGVQASAAKTLGAWGDATSVDRLKTLLKA